MSTGFIQTPGNKILWFSMIFYDFLWCQMVKPWLQITKVLIRRRLVCAYVVPKQQSKDFSYRGALPSHPGFCLATCLYLKTNIIFLMMHSADDTFARPSQRGGVPVLLFPQNQKFVFLCCLFPKIFGVPLFPSKLALLPLFAWNKCHFPCPPNPWESVINNKLLIQLKIKFPFKRWSFPVLKKNFIFIYWGINIVYTFLQSQILVFFCRVYIHSYVLEPSTLNALSGALRHLIIWEAKGPCMG